MSPSRHHPTEAALQFSHCCRTTHLTLVSVNIWILSPFRYGPVRLIFHTWKCSASPSSAQRSRMTPSPGTLLVREYRTGVLPSGPSCCLQVNPQPLFQRASPSEGGVRLTEPRAVTFALHIHLWSSLPLGGQTATQIHVPPLCPSSCPRCRRGPSQMSRELTHTAQSTWLQALPSVSKCSHFSM